MQRTKIGVIYRIYHKETSKSYIGQTTNYKKRIYTHFNESKNCTCLHNAIKKHGKDKFISEILESDIPSHLLNNKEQFYIKTFNTKSPNGYNLTEGGDGVAGYKPTKEQRQKRSESIRGINNHNYKKTRTQETKDKISKANKGYKMRPESIKKSAESRQNMKFSEQHKQNLSKARKGKPRPELKGRKHSTEHKQKISNSLKGIQHSTERNQKISEKLKGRIFSEETKIKMSISAKNRKRKKQIK